MIESSIVFPGFTSRMPSAPSSDPETPRFLLIQTAFIGDVILATPLIEKIRTTYPDAAIDLFLRKGNEQLFEGHPHIRSLYIWEKKKGKYRSLIAHINRIRRQHYHYCINMQRHSTTGLLTLFSGAKVTIGFTMNPFSRFFTRRYIHKIGHLPHLNHETDLYLQLPPHPPRCNIKVLNIFYGGSHDA